MRPPGPALLGGSRILQLQLVSLSAQSHRVCPAQGTAGRGLLAIQGEGKAGALGPGGGIPWAFRERKGDGKAEAASAGQPVLQTQSLAW